MGLAVSTYSPLVPKATIHHFLTDSLFCKVEATLAVGAAIFIVVLTVFNFAMVLDFFEGSIALDAF